MKELSDSRKKELHKEIDKMFEDALNYKPPASARNALSRAVSTGGNAGASILQAIRGRKLRR